MRFLCKTNYGIDLIIKRFHEENSIMSGLFSKSNLLLWGMQGIKGFLRKRRKISNITYTAIQFLLLTSAKFAVREFIILILHLMVLLCVIFKSV